MLNQIKNDLKNLLIKAGVTNPPELTTPPNPDMGDFALPCFALAKEQKKSPNEVANAIVDALDKAEWEKYELLQDVAAEGPYVNFFLKNSALAEGVIEAVKTQKENYGSNNLGQGKKVMVEYPSNNTHKEFHIGHLRNVCIGNTLVELYRKSGYDVVVVNYLNDFGAHVAKCLWGLMKFHQNEQPPENKQKWLGDIYAEASQYAKEHPESAEEIAAVQKRLEQHEPTLEEVFMMTRQWSIDRFEEIFKELGVQHQAVFYEKDLKDQGQKMVEDLLAKGIAKVGERGAIIIDLAEFNLDVALLRKADGSGLYLTSDLPLSQEKFKQFDVVESIYITGQEQNFYFKQLFKILELMGFHKKMTHIGYGLVNKPEGKMSSRLGNVVLYDELRSDVETLLMAASRERHPDWAPEKLEEVVRAITFAALKFNMQQHEAAKTFTFDAKQAVSFEGFSAPYILYVVARISSLFKKAPVAYQHNLQSDYALLIEPEEKKLVMMMARYGGVIEKALETYNPSVITTYCFELAQAFNDFYTKQSILNAADELLIQTRLTLCGAVQQVLKNALGILTINTIDEM